MLSECGVDVRLAVCILVTSGISYLEPITQEISIVSAVVCLGLTVKRVQSFVFRVIWFALTIPNAPTGRTRRTLHHDPFWSERQGYEWTVR